MPNIDENEAGSAPTQEAIHGLPQSLSINTPRAMDFVQMWNRWDVVHPSIFRCLEETYVNQFFRDGSLRLSSFRRFHAHKDEQRGDAGEGLALLQGTSDAGLNVFMTSSMGSNAFVLSGTTWLSRSLLNEFGCDAGFEIFDTTHFAQEVGRQLSGWLGGMEGHCVYQDGRIITRAVQWFFDALAEAQEAKRDLSFDDLFRLQRELGGFQHFLLKTPEYAHQAEYRMLWAMDAEVPSYIDIKCPRARQFCRPVDIASLY